MGKAKPMCIGALIFEKQADAIEHFKAMLGRYRIGQRTNDIDSVELGVLLQSHKDYESKVGAGVSHLVVMDDGYGWKCFGIVRTDASLEDFSYRRCITQIW